MVSTNLDDYFNTGKLNKHLPCYRIVPNSLKILIDPGQTFLLGPIEQLQYKQTRLIVPNRDCWQIMWTI